MIGLLKPSIKPSGSSTLTSSDCPHGAIAWVIHGTWAEDNQTIFRPPASMSPMNPSRRWALSSVVSFVPKDRQELGISFEEAAPLTDGFKVAVEPGRTGAVPISQKASALGSDPAHVGSLEAGREWLAALVARFGRLGHPDLLLRDGDGLISAHRSASYLFGSNFQIASAATPRFTARNAAPNR
jgi:hypothetical protein